MLCQIYVYHLTAGTYLMVSSVSVFKGSRPVLRPMGVPVTLAVQCHITSYPPHYTAVPAGTGQPRLFNLSILALQCFYVP